MGTHFVIQSADGAVTIKAKPGESVVLGRNPKTKVKDKSVSRQHLRVNLVGTSVSFEQLGANPSTVNGTRLKRGDSREVRADVELSLYNDQYKFRLRFPAVDAEPPTKKRARTEMASGEAEGPLEKKVKPSLNNWLKRDDATASSDRSFVWRDYTDKKMMVMTSSDVVGRRRVAGFDIDSTIIVTKSGKTFGVDYDDWKILFPSCAKRLREAREGGKKICFFTNQAGIEKGKVDKKKFQGKVDAIVRALDIPVQVYVSCGDSYYRKPLPGMWEFLEKEGNDGVEVDRSESVYVGDAAGRPENWKPKTKKDFSCSDRLFAINLDVPFLTPEEFFLGSPTPPFSLPEFDPRRLRSNVDLVASPASAVVVSDTPEIVVLVGSPAAGKSTFVKNHLAPWGYVHVNRDTLGTWQKCVQLTEEAASSAKSVAVDNTNGDVASRERYLAIAKKYNIQARCFVFDVPVTMAKHLNKFRRFVQPDKAHKDVNDMIINSHRKNYQEPKCAEGFEEIVRINFVPKFTDQNLEKLFFSFLVEK